MRALDATISVDPVRVNGQDAGAGVLITGEKPPWWKRDLWPYIIGAAALGAIWWLVKDDVEEEGAGVPGPFVE